MLGFRWNLFSVQSGGSRQGHKKGGLLLTVFALILCCQAVYQFIVATHLHIHGASEDMCSKDANSPFCAEQRLFRSWKSSQPRKEDGDVADEVLLTEDVSEKGKLIDGISNSTGLRRQSVDDTAAFAVAVRWKAAASLLDECASISASDNASGAAFTPPAYKRVAGVSTQAAEQKNASARRWAHQLISLQKSLEARMNELGVYHGNESMMTTTSLADEHVQHETQLATRLSRAAKDHLTWQKHLKTRMLAYGQDLCADPSRKSHASCAQFWTAAGDFVPSPSNTSSPMTLPALRGSTNSFLSWPAVQWLQTVATHSPKQHGGTAMVVRPHELGSAKWVGDFIPKVGCITVIPSTRSAMAYARYFLESFIDNFRAQTYEGQKQLILVHHANNTEAAALISHYADDRVVKAAVAFGGPLPSNSAYRFGAWSADGADVIARWDFDAWHHPEQLAMQVRAMALTSRPACLLQKWTVLQGEHAGENYTETGKAGKDGSWDASLVGDTKWMREYWRPLLYEQRRVLEESEAHHVVRVDDFPNLIVYNADLMDTGGASGTPNADNHA